MFKYIGVLPVVNCIHYNFGYCNLLCFFLFAYLRRTVYFIYKKYPVVLINLKQYKSKISRRIGQCISVDYE